MNDRPRPAVLEAIVPTVLALASLIGLTASLLLGSPLGAVIFAVLLLIFGLLASGVRNLAIEVRHTGMRLAADKDRVRAQADFEVISPKKSQERDVA